MNLLDRLIAWGAPERAIRRQMARKVLAHYDAIDKSAPRTRRVRRDTASPDMIVQRSASELRAYVRDLERNHDLTRGALRVLVNNIVGATGIGIEPQPRRTDGTIHQDYAAALRTAWQDWCRRPEVTHSYTWPQAQRMLARAWIRDGESFAQHLIGPIASLDHGTQVPYSLELFEADMIPLDYDDGDRIRQGIERNGWGRAVGYWVYRDHPLQFGTYPSRQYLRRIGAERMLHIATTDRIGQLRGVSEFASVLTRLDDIKDYEESERIAAKVAAMLTAYVKRGTPDMHDPESTARDEDGNPIPRELRLSPGMILDSLAVGEEIGMIKSDRPNPNLITFRQGQLRAVAAGIGASYSSVSRDYNGTYSAQRQELVEQWVHYATLADEFVSQCVRPVWEQFVQVAHLSGVARVPRDVVPGSVDDCLYIAQSMPWIDPLKEALAWEKLCQAGFASEVEAIRRRGGNPADVLEQIATWRERASERGLHFSSAAPPPPAPATAQEDDADE
ncbi:phage portal protein [Chitiniphilus purpureus]|uniref:Phage portal protein n=1 Tax=Chitiniphilus purpureus TaxID=2981137 RepID=A0ABY6DHP3_9NEIS|nr:phage portal protein [Chitiniphilus sp. CD1]UXY13859.1 phage portal protein [Chitiniphilus sp. CD1]